VTAGGVLVSLLYCDGCPNWRVADERLRTALARVGQPDAPIEYLTVTTPEQADVLSVGLPCRVYRTGDGLAGSPTVEQLVEALGGHGVRGPRRG
jgi:hypothetical protein